MTLFYRRVAGSPCFFSRCEGAQTDRHVIDRDASTPTVSALDDAAHFSRRGSFLADLSYWLRRLGRGLVDFQVGRGSPQHRRVVSKSPESIIAGRAKQSADMSVCMTVIDGQPIGAVRNPVAHRPAGGFWVQTNGTDAALIGEHSLVIGWSKAIPVPKDVFARQFSLAGFFQIINAAVARITVSEFNRPLGQLSVMVDPNGAAGRNALPFAINSEFDVSAQDGRSGPNSVPITSNSADRGIRFFDRDPPTKRERFVWIVGEHFQQFFLCSGHSFTLTLSGGGSK